MVVLTMDFYIPRVLGHFLLRGPDGKKDLRRAEAFFDEEQVRALAAFPGLKWKVWSISPDGTHGSGVYLFDTMADAQVRADYAKKYYWRKGLLFVDCRIYEVMEEFSRITRAPIDVPANPGCTPEQRVQLLSERAGNPIRKLKQVHARLKQY